MAEPAALWPSPRPSGRARRPLAEPADLLAEIEALGEKLGQARALDRAAHHRPGDGGRADADRPSVRRARAAGRRCRGWPRPGWSRRSARCWGCIGDRVQFTPDLMPADILGSEVLETGADGSRAFRFIDGPIFCQLLMADEINRASPRTQSALLQAMQETRGDGGRPAPRRCRGRSMCWRRRTRSSRRAPIRCPRRSSTGSCCRSTSTIPTAPTERDDPPGHHRRRRGGGASRSSTPTSLIAAQRLIRRMPVGEAVVERILDLVRAGRPGEAEAHAAVRDAVSWGPGPRAAQALMLAIRARALLPGAAGALGSTTCGAGAPGADPPHGAVLRRARRGRDAGRADRRGWSRDVTGPEAAA